MFKGVESRLGRLEARRGKEGPCSLCGDGPEVFELEYVDLGEEVVEEYCPECGRKTCGLLTWGDEK